MHLAQSITLPLQATTEKLATGQLLKLMATCKAGRTVFKAYLHWNKPYNFTFSKLHEIKPKLNSICSILISVSVGLQTHFNLINPSAH